MTHVPETGARKMESICGAGFWSECHSYYDIGLTNRPLVTGQQFWMGHVGHGSLANFWFAIYLSVGIEGNTPCLNPSQTSWFAI